MISRECFENKWFYMKYIGKYLSGEILLARECRLTWGTLYSWGPQATAQRAHVIRRTVSVTVHDRISITLTVTCVRFHIFPRYQLRYYGVVGIDTDKIVFSTPNIITCRLSEKEIGLITNKKQLLINRERGNVASFLYKKATGINSLLCQYVQGTHTGKI